MKNQHSDFIKKQKEIAAVKKSYDQLKSEEDNLYDLMFPDEETYNREYDKESDINQRALKSTRKAILKAQDQKSYMQRDGRTMMEALYKGVTFRQSKKRAYDALNAKRHRSPRRSKISR